MKNRPIPRIKKFRGDRLRGIRQETGYSQPELAELCGVGRTQIVNLEGCKTQPSIPTLIRLCDVLRISADYLLGVSDYPAPYDE